MVSVGLLVALHVLAAAAFVAWRADQSHFRPVAYQPLEIPAWEGTWALNERLAEAQKIFEGAVDGPEKLAVNPVSGEIFSATADGRLVVLKEDGSAETWADIGGRPLGFDFTADGNVYVADAARGLVFVDRTERVAKVVAHKTADGRPISFADDCAVNRQTGKVYLSDASRHRPVYREASGGHVAGWDVLQPSKQEGLEAARSGVVVEFDPDTRQARTIMRDLYMANGVCVSSDGEFVLVSSLFAAEVRRYWLRGPKAGTEEALLSPLPGYVDNIHPAARPGQVWLAFGQPRLDFEKFLPYPLVRAAILQLPDALAPKALPFGGAVLIDERTGEVLDALWDTTGRSVRHMSHVLEAKGKLWLGSFDQPNAWVLDYEYQERRA